jgi:hypothetical protein
MEDILMNRAAVLSFALLLGPCGLAAQSAGQGQSYGVAQMTGVSPDGKTASTTQILNPDVTRRMLDAADWARSACPVALHAQQSAAAFARQVNGNEPERPKGTAQRLHLSVTGQKSRRVVAANVTVHGFAGKPRMVQVLSTSGGDDSDAAKTLDVRFAAGAGQEDTADLWVPGLTAARSVNVNAVTYDDGTTWKVAAANSCQSLVDGMMLVSGR